MKHETFMGYVLPILSFFAVMGYLWLLGYFIASLFPLPSNPLSSWINDCWQSGWEWIPPLYFVVCVAGISGGVAGMVYSWKWAKSRK